MSQMPNPDQENVPGKLGAAPYETALNSAFNKLTSEIFVFLLAYTILLIALTALARNIPPMLRLLLFVIPVLGIIAYGWLKKRAAVRNPHAQGVRVRAGIVGSKGYVGGVRGPGQVPTGGLDVRGGIVSSGVLVGVDQANRDQGSAANFLVNIFEGLPSEDQSAVVRYALELQAKKKSE
jgi:hypothetical protein